MAFEKPLLAALVTLLLIGMPEQGTKPPSKTAAGGTSSAA